MSMKPWREMSMDRCDDVESSEESKEEEINGRLPEDRQDFRNG